MGIVLAVIATALVAVLVVRAMRGFGWLPAGDSPTLAAEQANPDLEFDLLPDTVGLYRVHDRRNGALGWIRLQLPLPGLTDGDRLTGPLRFASCDDVLPPWLSVYPKAIAVACIVAGTQGGERRFVSLTVDAADLPAASDYYAAVMAKLPEFGETSRGTSGEPGLDWRGHFEWLHTDQVQRVTVTALSDRWRPPAVLVVSVGDASVERR